MAVPQFKGATEQKHRYLVVAEIESDVPPTEDRHAYIVDLTRSEDFTGTSDEWHAMLEGRGGPLPDVEVVEVCAIKDMGAVG